MLRLSRLHSFSLLLIMASTAMASTVDQSADGQTPLSASDAHTIARQVWREFVLEHHEARLAELQAEVIRSGDDELRFRSRRFGEPSPHGRSLWISLHGGGNTSAEVNDRQWANQLQLYEPEEGIYIAPRAPTNTWNLWHREAVDRLIDRLIESAVIAWDIDPNRVYLLGYSAGGDGVYQLAPRMADRFAAAAMMAGHPNNASPLGLRNLPFAIYMGGDDAAYNRNSVAEQWGRTLAELREDDPDGYPHRVNIYPDTGHWMGGRDAEALPWMARHTRNAWPKRVVWRQGNVPHTRLYWLAVDGDEAAHGNTIIAHVDGQTITLESDDVSRVALLLHDTLIDLGQPIRIIANGKTVAEKTVARTQKAMIRSLQLRGDPDMIATAWLDVQMPSRSEENGDVQ